MSATALLIPEAPSIGSATPALRRVSPVEEMSQSGTNPLTFDLITDRAAFDELEAEWTSLFERAGHSHQLFLSFNWLWHWCNHFLPANAQQSGPRLHVLTARQNGRLVMVWPLLKERMHGLTVLSWMGDPVSQYGDVLVEHGPQQDEILNKGWQYLSSSAQADVIRLRRVRADAAIAPLMEELQAAVTETAQAPYLDLASAKDFAAYEQRYSGGTRRNRRRQSRRLDEQGAITFEELTSGDDARDLIATAVHLKRRWLTSRGLVSKAFNDSRFEHFFADVAAAEARPAGCRVAVLKSAGRPVAIEVAIGCKDRVALHVIVFDMDYEKSGAGVLLLEQSIRSAADSGIACYDLLAPGDAYKLVWADASVEVRDLALPLTLKGRLYTYAYLQYVRTNAKRIIAAMPAGLRRRLSAIAWHKMVLA